MTHREGEVQKQYFQSDRFFSIDNQWYFTTREGSELGPFSSMGDAQGELLMYIRHMNEGGFFAGVVCS